jgi:hypothetical protein
VDEHRVDRTAADTPTFTFAPVALDPAYWTGPGVGVAACAMTPRSTMAE